MPPRKKRRLSSQGPSTPSSAANIVPAQSAAAALPENTTKTELEHDISVSDPWTDEQETALLKAIIKWKPVGIHKHFRMLAISEHLKSHGYAPTSDQHTRIPGIWHKLGHLYNLPGLDEREDPFEVDGSEGSDSGKDLYCPFELPQEEYGEMMFDRRLAVHGSESPIMSVRDGSQRLSSTVADSDEPRSSPTAQSRRKTRNTRSTAKDTRSSRLQTDLESSRGRGSSKGTVANEGETAEEGEDEADEQQSEPTKDESDRDEATEEAKVEPHLTRSTAQKASRGKGTKPKTIPKRSARRR